MATVKDILSDTRAFVEEKRASAFNEKQGLAGQDPNTYPGAEHDKPVDPSMEQPDPGANEDVNSPSGAYSAKGAKPANQKEQGTALEATDAPPASVKKEPEVSGNAMAGPSGGGSVGDQPVSKHAELAAGLLGAIKKAQDTDEEPKPAEGEGEGEKEAADKKCEKCGEMYKDGKCGCEKKAEVAPKEGEGEEPKPAEGEPEKAAATPEITLTQDVLAKIAETMLATEEGWELVEQGLAKSAGAEAARETMQYLTRQEDLLQKQAARQQGYADAEALIHQAIYQKGVQDTKVAMAQEAPVVNEKDAEAAAQQGYADAGAILKAAQDLLAKQGEARPQPANPNEEILQRLGAALADTSVKNAQADLAALAGGAMPDMGALGAMGGMPGAEDAMAGMGAPPEDEEISPEELQEALAMMVQEGQISEEEAQAIMDYIASGEEMAGAEEAGAVEGADEAAAAGAEEEGMEAAASANDLLAAIQRVRASK
jgi:hypothetical protein